MKESVVVGHGSLTVILNVRDFVSAGSEADAVTVTV